MLLQPRAPRGRALWTSQRRLCTARMVGHHSPALLVGACERHCLCRKTPIPMDIKKRWFFFSPLMSDVVTLQQAHAARVESDDSFDDSGYDSDDYEVKDKEDDILLENAQIPRGEEEDGEPGGDASTSTYEQAVLYENGHLDNGQNTAPKNRSPIRSGFNLFLLFGAAIDRFVSRIERAILAAMHGALRMLDSSTAGVRRWLRLKRDGTVHKFNKSHLGKKVNNWKKKADSIQHELPEDMWGKLLWLWDRPPVQRLRLTVSMANLSFRLPALVALIVTQGSLLASQVSLPMLAPLLLGTGMMLRSIKSNASFLFPRIGLLVVLLWILWFTNSVIQNTVAYLKKQGALDDRVAGGVITITEVSTLLVALVVILSMLGVNVSALLLPAGIAVAVAAKDLSHNFLAGFFLFVVQPFKLGDRVAVSSSAPSQGPGPLGAPPGWFEGVCEKVDLRYTVVRQGKRKLVIPNSAFLTREFMVMDESGEQSKGKLNGNHEDQMEYLTNDNRHVWQYVHGPPVHQELAGTQMQEPIYREPVRDPYAMGPGYNPSFNSTDDIMHHPRNDVQNSQGPSRQHAPYNGPDMGHVHPSQGGSAYSSEYRATNDPRAFYGQMYGGMRNPTTGGYFSQFRGNGNGTHGGSQQQYPQS